MGRFTIWNLVVLVVISAGAFAALRYAGEVEALAGVLVLATTLLIATAILGAIYNSGPRRACWLGFILFALAYITLITTMFEWVPTNQLLSALWDRISDPTQFMDYGRFNMAGHCLFTVATGAIGAAVAWWFEARQGLERGRAGGK